MPNVKGLNFLDHRVQVKIIRQRKMGGVDFSVPTALIGILSDGHRFVLSPVLDRPLFLVGEDDPRKWAFRTAAPVGLIMLYQNGWIVVTEDDEEYLVLVDEERRQQ